MDGLQFARLVSWFCAKAGKSFELHELKTLETLVKPTTGPAPDFKTVEAMLLAMAAGRTIEAIKHCRDISGYGLKESKDLICNAMNKTAA